MVALLVIPLVIDAALQAAIVVAVASTAFIVFVAPHSNAASPRRVVGGHIVSVIVGAFFSAAFLAPELGDLVSTSPIRPGPVCRAVRRAEHVIQWP